jgi:hypothetical protein
VTGLLYGDAHQLMLQLYAALFIVLINVVGTYIIHRWQPCSWLCGWSRRRSCDHGPQFFNRASDGPPGQRLQPQLALPTEQTGTRSPLISTAAMRRV